MKHTRAVTTLKTNMYVTLSNERLDPSAEEVKLSKQEKGMNNLMLA